MRRYSLLAAFLAAVPAVGWANFAPIAAASVGADEALVGDAVRFSSDGSIDPDDAPAALSFFWQFPDGAVSSDPSPTHRFTKPGAWRVTLTVSDGADTAIASVQVHVLAPPTALRAARSGPLALSADGRRLLVVNPDSNSVTIVDTLSLEATREISVGRDPRGLALSDTGEIAFVVSRGSDELWALSASGEVLGVSRTAAGPVSVVVSPVTFEVVVACETAGVVQFFDRSGAMLRASLDVGADPRALAIDATGQRLYVSHFLSRGTAGLVSVVDLAARRKLAEVTLVDDPGPDTPSSGRGVPNVLGALAVEPSGNGVWVGGLKANSASGPLRDGRPLAPTNWVRGVAIRLNPATQAEELARRIDTNDADSVSAIAFSPNGRWAYFTHAGAGTLSIYDLSSASALRPGAGATVPTTSRIDVGEVPDGIVVSPDGRRAYVSSYLSRSIAVVDIVNPAMARVTATVASTAEPLSPPLLNGKRQFFSSKAPRHSKDNYVACASCHPEGGHDGRTWDTTQKGEGLRNTKDLRGRGGLADGPLHWSANFDEVQDFERDIVVQFGGTGLAQDGQPPNAPLGASNAGRSADLDDLARFVASLTEAPPSPHRAASGELTPAAARGRSVFESAGCAECHPAPRYTDSTLTADGGSYVLRDIGTLASSSGSRLGEPLTGLDTPSLLGLWASAPYLHDGSAATLNDVLRRPGTVKARLTDALAPAELADLVEFLVELDGRPEVGPPPLPEPPKPLPQTCGCTVSSPALLSCLLCLAVRRRRRGDLR